MDVGARRDLLDSFSAGSAFVLIGRKAPPQQGPSDVSTDAPHIVQAAQK
jgi:hypothetical protein